MDKIIDLLESALENNTLIKLSFGDLRKKSNPYKKVNLRPLMLQGELCYQAEYHFQNKVTHKNFKKSSARDYARN